MTGTHAGPGGAGKAVRLSGYEKWTMAADSLILDGVFPGRGGAVLDRGSCMQVWKMEPDGHWRFVRDIWNSSAPV